MRKSYKAAILCHTPNPGFKSELVSFVTELHPDDRFWSSKRRVKMLNEKGQQIHTDIKGPISNSIQEYWKI